MLKTSFAPELYVPNGTMSIDFYKTAFGATENLCFKNDDGSIHVSELVIDGVIFHVHEENRSINKLSPASANGITATIGLMVDDVDAVMARAIAAGAKEISPAQDYFYGYRQGELTDVFGHRWMIEKKLFEFNG